MNSRTALQTLAATLALLTVLSMQACGSGRSGSTDEGSTSSSSTSSNKTTAVCTASDQSKVADIEVRAMAYTDAYAQTNLRYVRVKMEKIPSRFASENLDLKIFRWTANTSGASNMDSVPLKFKTERRVGAGFQLISNYDYQIWNYETETLGTARYIKLGTDNAQTFFNTVTFLVDTKDTLGEFKALRAVLYTSTGAVAFETDILIPPFSVDPSEYAATRSSLLSKFHPLNGKTNEGWTTSQLKSFTDGFCF